MAERTRTLTFVVGTGRCGSTALSRVLRLHPEVLSVSELIASVEPGALPEQPLTGGEFWQLLASSRPFADRMIREGTPLPEHLYPGVAGGRFSATDGGIPALCLTTLPHLTDEPDALFDALEPVLAGRGRAPAAEHYRALFGALAAHVEAEHAGGEGPLRAVVERSGFSLGSVPRLRAAFPEARFVHLHRDGPDCALSMSRHAGFRLLRTAAQAEEGSEEQEIAAALGELTADDGFDLRGVLERPVPVERFGELWSGMITEGLAHLADVPAELRASLSYEDLLDAPEPELTALARHLGVEPHPAWLKSASALLDGARRGASAALPPPERARLAESCAPGMRALARI
ncbi:sulfotransferase family protein [Streptomyces sp. Amel2xB2]|uniref:sulfotransferase family protein n=1 Tax=Streptomyces sp. Amel2xB2 TaxID=1305829 RepID=UPI000DB9A813|nr:sulfotransferase [Streptomyces sp. Amel2xB2]RAJ62425.1 sulfotransferase family protein [Streptomyces sp. Amel2xB2]